MSIEKELIGVAEKGYADFHTKIANTRKKILGVRMPVLRKIARKTNYYEIKDESESIYEIVMLKALTLTALPYEEIVKNLDDVLVQVDSWAFIDCMLSHCKNIKNNSQKGVDDFAYLTEKGEFFKRFYIVFTMLYAPTSEKAKQRIKNIKCGEYYVDMAIAWYLSVLFVLDFDSALEYSKNFSPTIWGMTKRKCLDSFRLTSEHKNRIKSVIFQ